MNPTTTLALMVSSQLSHGPMVRVSQEMYKYKGAEVPKNAEKNLSIQRFTCSKIFLLALLSDYLYL